MSTAKLRLQELIAQSLDILQKMKDAETDLRRILSPDLSDENLPGNKDKVKRQNKPHQGNKR